MTRFISSLILAIIFTSVISAEPKGTVLAAETVVKRQPDGDGSIKVSGELKQWHKVTLTLDGPFAHELDNAPNPFTDYYLRVAFTHESGKKYYVPGYFAADGDAANSSADSGTKWRVNFTPDLTGSWNYSIIFLKAKMIFTGESDGVGRVQPLHEKSGSFTIAASDKQAPDFRARGRLQYVGKHYLQFAGTKEYFIKAGADAPETFLACVDFDNTLAGKRKVPLKTWTPHLQDWKSGDPTWKDGKGKGIIGALNYLSSRGANAFSFLTYNAGGDGDNVWPFVQRDDKFHYDCSKLDQWTIVLDHAQKLGLYLHFKTEETENDDADGAGSAQSLDGGALGMERKLYYRELVARFGHELALNWNFGEENSQTPEQQREEIAYVASIDPYQHLRVIHTFPPQQEKVYSKLIGKQSMLTGASLQNEWNEAHQRTFKWVTESSRSGKPWVVANDEQGSAGEGVPPDPGYKGFGGKAGKGKDVYDLNDIRKYTLWGTLMAGGQGVEYYFGYKLPQNDLVCEDYRSRDKSWEYAGIAIRFFQQKKIPVQDMTCRDELVGNQEHDNSKYCLAKEGEIYLVYLPNGGGTDIKLPAGNFSISWFNPRTSEDKPAAPMIGRTINAPDQEDWLALIRKAQP